MRTIISRGLYIFHPTFTFISLFSSRFFSENYFLMTKSSILFQKKSPPQDFTRRTLKKTYYALIWCNDDLLVWLFSDFVSLSQTWICSSHTIFVTVSLELSLFETLAFWILVLVAAGVVEFFVWALVLVLMLFLDNLLDHFLVHKYLLVEIFQGL